MRTSKILLLLVLFSLPGWQCGREASTPTFDAEKTVGPWVALWNTYDLSMVDSLFLPDARLTYFSSEKEGLIQGIEAVREHHVGFGFVEGGKAQENELWLEDLHAESFGNTATVTGIWYFRSVSGDSSTTSRGPVTFVYVSEEGTYRISHVHFASY